MMMICTWGLINDYSNSNIIQKFWVRGKKETQKGLPVVRVNSDSGRHAEKSRTVAYTRKDIRLSCSCGSRCTWWCNYPRRYYCLRPWFSTISFSELELYIPLYHSRLAEICQGNRGFVYNSFTNSDYKSLLATTEKRAPFRWGARGQFPSGHTKRCSQEECSILLGKCQ